MLELQPIEFEDACEFIKKFHRHHIPPPGGKFWIGCVEADKLVGVAIVGRPVARMADDGFTLEVTRLCSDGTRNVCSFLYRACWRVTKNLGYKRLITYILSSESGTSLKASGFKLVAETKGGSWSRESRVRIDKHPLQNKLKFEIC